MKQLCTIIFLTMALTCQAQKAQSLDSLVINQVIIDVGQVHADTVLTQDFIVTNAGSTIVDVEGLTRSCTCTSAEIDRKTLKPGEKAKVTLTVDTHGKSGRFLIDAVLIANTRQRFYKMIVKGLI